MIAIDFVKKFEKTQVYLQNCNNDKYNYTNVVYNNNNNNHYYSVHINIHITNCQILWLTVLPQTINFHKLLYT